MAAFRGILHETVIVSVLVFLAFLIYSNTKEAPFILDDGHNIVNNPGIRLNKLSLEELGKAAFESPLRSRPLANISFAINHYFHRYDVKGFRFINVLLHALTGICLYFFIKNTLKTPALSSCYERYQRLPFFATVLWLVHPVQTQSVTYIVQRMNCLSSLFYVLALWFYVRGRLEPVKKKKLSRYVGCVLAGIMSLGSKEIAATLPLFIFLHEWYFFRQLDLAWLRRQLYPFICVLFFLVALTFLYLGGNPLETLIAGYQGPDFSLGQRLLTQSRVIVFYLSLIFLPLPSRMNLDHHFLYSTSLVEPLTTLLSCLILLMLIAAAILLARRERLISFCLVWFLGNLMIESSVVALELVFEHRLYLPSMMVILMTAVMFERFIKPVPLRTAFLYGLVIILSIWTYERNLVWQDAVKLWHDSANKSPDKFRPNNNVAMVLMDEGEMAHAFDHLKMALEARPFNATLHKNMGSLMLELNRPEAAVHHYKWAARISPADPELHYVLGGALMKLNLYAEAVRSFAEAVKIKPDYKPAHLMLEVSRGRQKKTEITGVE